MAQTINEKTKDTLENKWVVVMGTFTKYCVIGLCFSLCILSGQLSIELMVMVSGLIKLVLGQGSQRS
jgi:hypothetical protein